MSNAHMLITITLIALTTIALRFLPFWIFPPSKQPPALITYLGKVLPRAAIALLVVYALKDVSIVTSPHGIPELVAILAIVVVHVFKRNTLLSIATGTILYMMMVQLVF